MAIQVRNVGHVVLKVRDIERAAHFYRDVLGLKEVARGTFGRPTDVAFDLQGPTFRHEMGLSPWQFGSVVSAYTLSAGGLLSGPTPTAGGYGFNVRVLPTYPHLLQAHELRLIAWA